QHNGERREFGAGANKSGRSFLGGVVVRDAEPAFEVGGGGRGAWAEKTAVPFPALLGPIATAKRQRHPALRREDLPAHAAEEHVAARLGRRQRRVEDALAPRPTRRQLIMHVQN